MASKATVEPVEGYCITAMYDDGEPMSYAAVEIKAPQGRRSSFKPAGPIATAVS